MFKNVGKKIKTLAKVFYWILFITYCLAGLILLVYAIYEGIVLFNANRTEHGILSIVVGVVGAAIAVGLGVLFGWLSNVLLYGFGELIDQTMEINRKMGNPKRSPQGMRPPMPPMLPLAPQAQAPIAPPPETPVPDGYCCEMCNTEIFADTTKIVRTPDGVEHMVCPNCYQSLVGSQG